MHACIHTYIHTYIHTGHLLRGPQSGRLPAVGRGRSCGHHDNDDDNDDDKDTNIVMG